MSQFGIIFTFIFITVEFVHSWYLHRLELIDDAVNLFTTHVEGSLEVLCKIVLSLYWQSNIDVNFNKIVDTQPELTNERLLQQGCPSLPHNLQLLSDGFVLSARSLLIAQRVHLGQAYR